MLLMECMSLSTPPAAHSIRSVAATPATSFHLTADQIRSFDENGYLVLKHRITGPLLARIQEAGHRWIEQAKASEGQSNAGQAKNPNQADTDYAFAKRPGGKTVPFRVNYLHNKGESASLELLGAPEILAIAESLAGPDFVPTYESMVFKMAGDGEIIPWHQDAVFQKRNHRVFNIDIYLDAASRDGGALRVIPKSQTAIHDVCKMNDGTYDWINGAHEIMAMEPGDVLIHDDMVLHGSPRTLQNQLRRVVYFEFRPAAQIFEEGPWDRGFVDQRLRLLPLAMKRHQDAFPERPQFQWNADASLRPRVEADEADALRVVHTVHTPGSYCSANSK